MASKYFGDLVFSTGEYEKDGKTKKRWSKAGAVFKDDETGNISIKFEAMPVGEWSGWMKIFENKKVGSADNAQTTKDAMIDDISDEPISLDEIPF